MSIEHVRILMSDVQPESLGEELPISEADTAPPQEDMFSAFLGELGSNPDIPLVEDVPVSDDDSGLFGDINQPVGDGTCDVCGAPTFRPPGLTAAGRKKRVPRLCDL